MADLTREEAEAEFAQYLPGIEIIALDHDRYIREAEHHPFIAAQIRMGIYDEENFGREFLSVARSYSSKREVEVDFDLLLEHMKGVPKAAALGYCAQIALHEYHHISSHHEPVATTAEQVKREMECAIYMHDNHPEIVALSDEAERLSSTIQRVFGRLAALTPKP